MITDLPASELGEPEREDAPKPEPQNGPSSHPSDPRCGVTTYVYDARGGFVEIRAPEQCRGSTVYPYDAPAPLPLEWEHLPDKRLYAPTIEEKTEYWRDNPTRYLVIQPDPKSGKLRPALEHGRPVYLWLCREERETR